MMNTKQNDNPVNAIAKKLATLLIQTVLILSVIVIQSCTSVNSKVGGVLNLDTDLKLAFTVDADINPDEKSSPSPLFVRLYELKSTKMFDKADFIELYERDKETLGADFVAKQELKRLRPGESRVERLVLDKDTRYVALYAEFFRYKDANYKLIFPVTANNLIRNSFKIQVSGNTIAVNK